MSSESVTPEQYRQRALLLADLGRYDEAAGELAEGLAAAPADKDLLTTLARLHLAADQPAEALGAAERAVAADPDSAPPILMRAMALVELRRFTDAAQLAADVLVRWPADPYAQRAGAALLSESRNGQQALDAAWRGVTLVPTDAEAHLVLSVVAARLHLFDLAQRAYAEALELDETLAEAQRDVGVVRLERRRWARALEELAEAATLPVPVGEQEPPPPVSRPTIAPPDRRTVVGRVREIVRAAATSTLVSGVLTAFMTLASSGASRVWAGVWGSTGLAVLLIWTARRLPRRALVKLWSGERLMMIAWVAVAVAMVLVVTYTAVGGLWPLVAALALAALAELFVVFYRPPV